MKHHTIEEGEVGRGEFDTGALSDPAKTLGGDQRRLSLHDDPKLPATRRRIVIG
jgi:hypothetical protein